jgi:hypothetical protein
MYHARLPQALKPRRCESLVRLGDPQDGGYLVDERDVLASAGLLSLGIHTDWSFEADFTARNDVVLDAYDATTGRSLLFGEVLRASLMRRSWSETTRMLQAFATYRRFFSGHRQHLRRFVGSAYPPHYMTLRSAFDTVQQRAPQGPIFIKCDIEGWEYRSLDDLIALAPDTSGLAIEFHDCDLQIERIVQFIERYPLHLVHVHANNGAPIADGIALALELTFSSHPPGDEPAVLPHPLDAPNVADRSDISIEFA